MDVSEEEDTREEIFMVSGRFKWVPRDSNNLKKKKNRSKLQLTSQHVTQHKPFRGDVVQWENVTDH